MEKPILLKQKNNARDYRPDIDGLRAVAVFSVVFFHLGMYQFSGGYVGVDIFFVITGFLFGRIVLNSIEDRSFSFILYYRNRFTRLVPALILVILVASVIAWFLLLPDDLLRFWESVKFSVLSSSNILFSEQAGYFDTAATSKPLLHFWTLSVECQFYLIAPLVSAVSFVTFRTFGLLWFALAISFIWSTYMVLAEPVKAYYLLAPRAWEILTGSIVWRISCFWSPSTKHINFFSLIGIALLLLAICGYDNTTPFPGIAALFPCIGTAILLYLGAADKNKGVVFGVLRAPPLVFLGRISYPIYLWHWPVIAFSTYYLERQFLL